MSDETWLIGRKVDASKKIFGSAGINRHGVENERVLH